ncbi:oxidoreductase [Arsenicitalea aurantiaca]|uniref:Oxidoreductase n=1 Tax=Arsenicitalea aurantiaca TaxID=1783274 RepID=A0A433X833_9HYPH|nr:aldo/keto reductase [Arsenicitalea aurantiaca]RUT30224.1 oxidoreductase [Arsenicitalea aurantiaca]
MSKGRTTGWAILGTGNIARAFARGIAESDTGRLVAVGTRDPGREGLAEHFPGARFAVYEAVLADPEIDAVYIALPHTGHAQWAILAAEAGKHVLVEKPMALTAFEADAMIHAARKAGTFLGEAFMYRLHPQTQRLIDLIAEGAIGEVRLIRSSFGFKLPGFMPEHRLYANDLAGGGILDVCGYPVSMVRLVAGAATGRPFLDPDRVAGVAHLGQSGVDEWASAVLHFPGGIIAEVSGSISVAQDNVLRIFGTEGRIEVQDFWFGSGKFGGTGEIAIIAPDGTRRIETVTEARTIYAFEVDAVGRAIAEGRQEFAAPGMDWADSLGTLRVLDTWRADIGLEYGIETAARRRTTLSGRPLGRNGTRIPRREIRGLARPASVLALGFEDFRTFSSGAILLDAYFEAGGNVFDTAWIYRAGQTETLLGQWLANRDVRDEALIIGKGAHSPLCRPEWIGRQLTESLERLGTDHVDLYFMHRDNPDVPVDEFVDAMDAEVKAGRIRGLFGGSNWSRERMAAAIDYAERSGKTAPGALSNNFSLARMENPIWAGCVSASEPQFRDWLVDRQMPNFAWSSQARGFFTERAAPGRLEDAELVHAWYSEANFARKGRAELLAAEKGCRPIHIALAYVLGQPFPSIPLIGPRRLGELEDSLTALKITLSPEEIAFLETGTPAQSAP